MTDDTQDRERLLRGLMDSHGGAVRIIVARHEHDQTEAEEVWSDVFQLAYERIQDVANLPESQQRSWLLRTARFLTANRGRRNATRRRTLAADPQCRRRLACGQRFSGPAAGAAVFRRW